MEPRGGTSGVKPVDVDPKRVELHDTDNSELSMSTASNTMLPHLEATDVERALNDEERRRRKEARKAKREVREEKKKEQQRLEDKKRRKEERKLKREARRKRKEARKKKEEEEKATNASSSDISSSSKDRDDDESYQVSKEGKMEKKGKGKVNSNNKYAAISFN
ncbi:protein PXR1-like [Miscanthus floridulus]|uniref:protein PXR1-like n=1 Tax=Miscanthus floridulus TaxID=154761 RepID=UPI003459BC1C